jgi:hypothetical protein
MLSSEVQSLKPESIKSLDIGDIAIMNQLAYSFKDEIKNNTNPQRESIITEI